jgi:NADH:ubiquinone reductase (H+-translocating)
LAVDTAAREVALEDGARYGHDILVLATGARHDYFGNEGWAGEARGLKKIEDATAIRCRLLAAFEDAETCADPARRAALLTFVIVGAGPTGVEMAGAIAELAQCTLRREFRTVDTAASRVVLVEAGQRVLPSFPERLSENAHAALRRLGVEVRLGQRVTRCGADGVDLGDEHIPAANIVWAAGVAASPPPAGCACRRTGPDASSSRPT